MHFTSHPQINHGLKWDHHDRLCKPFGYGIKTSVSVWVQPNHLQKHRKPWRTMNLAPRDWRFPTGAVCKKKFWSKCKNESSNKALPTQSPTQKSRTLTHTWRTQALTCPFVIVFHLLSSDVTSEWETFVTKLAQSGVTVAARVSSKMCHNTNCAPTL